MPGEEYEYNEPAEKPTPETYTVKGGAQVETNASKAARSIWTADQASEEAAAARQTAMAASTTEERTAARENVLAAIESYNTAAKNYSDAVDDGTAKKCGLNLTSLSTKSWNETGDNAANISGFSTATSKVSENNTKAATANGCSGDSEVLALIEALESISETSEKLGKDLDAINNATDAYRAALEAEIAARTGPYAPTQDPNIIEDLKNLLAALDKESEEGGVSLSDVTTTTPPFFNEQCFLLAEIQHLVKYKTAELDGKLNGKRLPYTATPAVNGVTTEPWNNKICNASLLARGDPFAFINHLTQHPGYTHLMTMQTDQIANLQPMIRLYKIITERDSDGNPISPPTQFPIPFDSTFTENEIINFGEDKSKRGIGVGVQDFTFSYEADNPFAIKKSIKAKLTLFANSFDELLVPRGTTTEFKYVDLALKTGVDRSLSLASFNPKETDVKQENLAKLDFRLKAVVGWAYRSDWPNNSTLTTDVKDAIYNSCVTLNLTPTVHTFDIDDQGRVKFVINYLAYVEDFYDQPNFNIFNSVSAEKNRIERKIKAQTWVTKCASKEYSELQKAQKTEIEEDRVTSFQSLIGGLFENHKIRFIQLESADVLKFRQEGPFFDASQIIGKVSTLSEGNEIALSGQIQQAIGSGATEEDRVKLLSIAGTGAENKTQTLSFFYVSDLMDLILEGIDEKFNGDNSLQNYLKEMRQNPGQYLKTPAPDEKPMDDETVLEQIDQQVAVVRAMGEQYKNFRLLLGPLEIVSPDENKESLFPSLGDLPISVKYFTEWLSRKMAKRDEVYYPLPKFLNDFFNELIREFLNSNQCFSNEAKQKTRVNQAVVTSYRDTTNHADEITELIWGDRNKTSKTNISRLWLKDHKNTRPLLKNIGGDRDLPIVEKGVDKEINYLAYFAGRTQPAEQMTGDEATDHTNGIFHYSIGRDRGITKTIKLKKTDSTGLKELRFEQDGYDGLKQLREVFDVDIETYANVSAFPGSYIYVDPRGFSPNTVIGSDTIDLTQIGIGGYHMIIRSEHSFGPGRANSRIHAKWVASTNAKATNTPSAGSMTTASPTRAIYCWSEAENSNREQEAKDGSGLMEFVFGGES